MLLPPQVSSLCAVLCDPQVLVKRQAMDFVLCALPAHNKQLTQSDMTRLCEAAINTLLKRDMSLNRRVYSWLLGTQVSVAVLTGELGLQLPSRQVRLL